MQLCGFVSEKRENEMQEIKSRGLTRDAIKMIAMLTMFFNHFSHVFLTAGTYPAEFLKGIGYFTAPVMCYFLVEGFYYTHSRRKYGERLLIFAGISQVPYMMAFDFSQLNMIFTLFICFMILVIQDKMMVSKWRIPLTLILLVLSVYSDWAILAPVFTIWFHAAWGNRKKMVQAYGIGAVLFAAFNYASYAETLPAAQALLHALLSAIGIIVSGIIIICFYNGKKSEKAPKFSKWFFYIFYPAHLLILSLIKMWIL